MNSMTLVGAIVMIIASAAGAMVIILRYVLGEDSVLLLPISIPLVIVIFIIIAFIGMGAALKLKK